MSASVFAMMTRLQRSTKSAKLVDAARPTLAPESERAAYMQGCHSVAPEKLLGLSLKKTPLVLRMVGERAERGLTTPGGDLTPRKAYSTRQSL
jgi:hypothetical protein